MTDRITYIGVAGLKSRHVKELAEHHKRLFQLCSDNQPTPLLFIGLQVSRKSLQGEPVNPVYADRMNTKEEILEACEAVKSFPRTKIIVHYNPSGDYSAQEVQSQIEYLVSTGVHGIQWNGFKTEYTPTTCPKFEKYFGKSGALSKMEFSILQLGKSDFIFPEASMLRLSQFTNNYSHVLFDPSVGMGKNLDISEAVNWVQTLVYKRFQKGIAVSGGLGPNELDIIKILMGATGNKVYFSIDAEGKLRDDSGFSLAKAKNYLDDAVLLYL